VKVAVALALGLGTMIGWKRIVVTVGEKIGKTHLTYAQGASAELGDGDDLAGGQYGLPVSTTHVLSSGVAGTMAANKSGLQMSTVRDIALAWVFTLPAAALLSGCLFWLFPSGTILEGPPDGPGPALAWGHREQGPEAVDAPRSSRRTIFGTGYPLLFEGLRRFPS
jgi:hypothetical protein